MHGPVVLKYLAMDGYAPHFSTATIPLVPRFRHRYCHVRAIRQRGPPAAAPTQDQLALELQYVDADEFLAAL
ncbi:MAG: hypothetical protein A3K19_12475 [Lentisphaerae bacterium RIFOXYB12_FULL_65_16]|nr:MAG: hypothetical protein A3K18_01740 [Lentisphaerae bacterium RIFOXYA12_64_32]OGV92336.1 MAG: hypothetical protein A3K19_12475 [Lentisphaerae bacterium RIFOXYB12_FULL_65_16]